MCGIVGYIGKQKATSIILEGLKRLEYRGYDSAGLVVCEAEGFKLLKKAGRVETLSRLARDHRLDGSLGIGHTRWATHGGVDDANSHPHQSSDGTFVLVHNGVIENYQTIKNFLEGKGYVFASETDSEALVNLIAYHYQKEGEAKPETNGRAGSRFLESVRKALFHVEGTYGIAVLCADAPNEMIGARHGSPLILGVGDGETLLASDVSAIISRTKNVVYLKDNEIVHVSASDFTLSTVNRGDVTPIIAEIDWSIEESEIGLYNHYMEKEIAEQPSALENTMRGRFSDDYSTANFGGLNISAQEFRHVDRLLFCGCGTTWHACLVAEYLIERYARIPVEVEYASEFRYRNAPLDKNTLFFVMSQSGETIDTLAALREAKRKGFRTLAINNSVGSSIAREADGGIFQHVGPEIGVASTKAFTSQILLAAMLALYMGRLRDMSYSDGRAMVKALKEAPELVEKVLAEKDKIRDIARRYSRHSDFLFLGRQAMFPVALEGALKLKEISYIHAEGYPAAEMKHGPIALVSEACPSVFLTPEGETFHKMVSNMQEVKARKGNLIAVKSESGVYPSGLVREEDTIVVPDAHESIQPILFSIPLQLLSYYIAVERGCDVDKPRNLAKSVTVE
ncbi:MAG: glutamine--fructose-6-phosphate transaminase (isomerizing) [Opitutales bacterium]